MVKLTYLLLEKTIAFAKSSSLQNKIKLYVCVGVCVCVFQLVPDLLTFTFQILRMLHVDRQGGTWRLLGSVVFIHRQVLAVQSFSIIMFEIFCFE